MSDQKVSNFTKRFAQLVETYTEQGGTQREFAKILGVSRQTVGAWANGDRSPKQPMIESIAIKFNVNVAWLHGYDVEMQPPEKGESNRDPRSAEFARLFAMLTDEKKQFIIQSMKGLLEG